MTIMENATVHKHDIRRNDTVKVISGRDKGKTGETPSAGSLEELSKKQ